MANVHKIAYDDGDVYEGEWSEDGKRTGNGKLVFVDKSAYCGQFKDGFFSGNGVLTRPDGSKYEGEFDVGKYHGYGVFTGADGMKYEGQFQDGRVRGCGLVTLSDGSHGRPRNEGRFDDNKCVERCKAQDAVRKSRQSATTAKATAQQL